MGSLILQVISIALFAAVTVAVAYFGGSALIGGGAKANASGVVNQGQQLQGTLSMYAASNGGSYPADLATLETQSFLSAVPQLPGDIGASANAWIYDPAGTWLVTPSFTSAETCLEVEKLRTGDQDIAIADVPTAATVPAVGDLGSTEVGTFGCLENATNYYAYYRFK